MHLEEIGVRGGVGQVGVDLVGLAGVAQLVMNLRMTVVIPGHQ